MARIFDGVTKLVLESANTPMFNDPSRYAINPTFIPDLPLYYQTVVGGRVVEASDEEKAEWDAKFLAEAKQKKLEEIDTRTRDGISRGFYFDNKQFSLSTQAQINLLGLRSAVNDKLLTFPHRMSTTDDTVEYVIPDLATLEEILAVATGHIKYYYDGGRTLKLAVRDCSTIDAVNAVKDTRSLETAALSAMILDHYHAFTGEGSSSSS